MATDHAMVIDEIEFEVRRNLLTGRIERIEVGENGHAAIIFNQRGKLNVRVYHENLDLYPIEHTIWIEGDDFNPMLRLGRYRYRLAEIAKLVHDKEAIVLY